MRADSLTCLVLVLRVASCLSYGLHKAIIRFFVSRKPAHSIDGVAGVVELWVVELAARVAQSMSFILHALRN